MLCTVALTGGFKKQLGIIKQLKSQKHVKPKRSRSACEFVALYKKSKVTSGDLISLAAAVHAEAKDVPADVQALAGISRKAQRVRKGKLRVDSRHHSREVTKVLEDSSETVVPCYYADATLWKEDKNQKTISKIAYMPIHEVLDHEVVVGEEHTWCSLDGESGFQEDLDEWKQRVNFNVVTSLIMLLALWGDSAPYTKKDSLYLLVYTVLSGMHRKKLWFVACGKRQLCRCGCFGRCTFALFFQYCHGHSGPCWLASILTLITMVILGSLVRGGQKWQAASSNVFRQSELNLETGNG